MMAATGARMRSAQGAARLDLKALAAFFALAYVLSWSWVIPLAAAHQVVHRSAGWPTHYPSLLGPAIAAVVGHRVDQGQAGTA
jgi:CAAX protease family protein